MHTRHALWLGLFSILFAIIQACSTPVEPDEGVTGVASEPLPKSINCKGLTPEACSERCANEGLHCISRRFHPTNRAIGKGDLYKCSTIPPASCTYRFSNGEVCYFFQSGRKPLCLIVG
jgi:hypothetical protein